MGTQPTARDQMFHVALVIAESEGTQTAQQGLPKGVQKAISDLQDFLPYKSYRMIDSSLVRADGRGKTQLKGPAGEQYTASLDYRDADKDSYLVEQFALTKMKAASPDAKPLARGVAPLPPEQPLVSSFRITRGETVVVGSSGLGAGKALIVVLTAMP
jgi:hypothetical protein